MEEKREEKAELVQDKVWIGRNCGIATGIIGVDGQAIERYCTEVCTTCGRTFATK